jgi:hypothetical protein
MTPFIANVGHLTKDSTPVCLADSTTVKATHVGRFSIPFGEETSIKTLVVPKLHEPLLSVAGLCDENLTVIFGKSSCRIFKTFDLTISGTEVGVGYRRGNLFYLPAEKDVRFPLPNSATVFSSSSVIPIPTRLLFDSTLLSYHNLLSHLGVRPLKAFL